MYEATTESLSFPMPGRHRLPETDDPLTSILRQGAQQLLTQAVEAEVEAWINDHGHITDAHGFA